MYSKKFENVSSPILTLLFIGDSITEANRRLEKEADLGTGYVMMIAKRFSAEFPEIKARFLNRGVGGNRVRDLKNRWQKDCLDLRPDVVSILIGINDVFGKYFWSRPTSTKSFEEDYRSLLDQTQDILNAKLILLTPFIVCLSKMQFIRKIFLQQKIKVVKKLSKEFGTILVPLDSIFEEALRNKAPAYWTTDGIHPTSMGHLLIAQSWIKAIKGKLF